jgi:iron complex outermembrane receptor protein
VFTTNNALADATRRDHAEARPPVVRDPRAAVGRVPRRVLRQRLRVNAGVRAPWFTRDLNNYCFTSSDTGFVECFGSATDPRNATFATLNPTIQGPAAAHPQVRRHPAQRRPGVRHHARSVDVRELLEGPAGAGHRRAVQRVLLRPEHRLGPAEPETTDNFDAGVRYTTSRIQAQLVGWYTGYDNRLASAYDPVTDRNLYRNLGTVTKYGIDGSIAFRPVDPVVLYVFGSWLESEIEDDVVGGECTAAQVSRAIFGCTTVGQTLLVATAGNREAGAPAYTYGAQGRVTLGPVDLGLTAKRTGGRYIYDTNLPVFAGTAPTSGAITPRASTRSIRRRPRLLDGQPRRADQPRVDRLVDERTYLQLNVYNLFDQLYVGNFTSGSTRAT